MLSKALEGLRGAGAMTAAERRQLKVADLRAELGGRGLDTAGKKAELLARLERAVAKEVSALAGLPPPALTGPAADALKPTRRAAAEGDVLGDIYDSGGPEKLDFALASPRRVPSPAGDLRDAPAEPVLAPQQGGEEEPIFHRVEDREPPANRPKPGAQPGTGKAERKAPAPPAQGGPPAGHPRRASGPRGRSPLRNGGYRGDRRGPPPGRYGSPPRGGPPQAHDQPRRDGRSPPHKGRPRGRGGARRHSPPVRGPPPWRWSPSGRGAPPRGGYSPPRGRRPSPPRGPPRGHSPSPRCGWMPPDFAPPRGWSPPREPPREWSPGGRGPPHDPPRSPLPHPREHQHRSPSPPPQKGRALSPRAGELAGDGRVQKDGPPPRTAAGPDKAEDACAPSASAGELAGDGRVQEDGPLPRTAAGPDKADLDRPRPDPYGEDGGERNPGRAPDKAHARAGPADLPAQPSRAIEWRPPAKGTGAIQDLRKGHPTPLPPRYVSHRCQQPGHLITNCPTEGDRAVEAATVNALRGILPRNKKNRDAGQADITDARMLLGGKRKREQSGGPPDKKPADKRPPQQKDLLAPSKRPNRSKAAKPGKARIPVPKVKDPAPQETSVLLRSAATKEKAGVRLTEQEKRAKRAQRFAK